LFKRIARAVTRSICQLLLIESVNKFVFQVRFLWYVRILRTIRTYEREDHVMAAKYSIDMLLDGRTSHRPIRLLRPLSVLDHVNPSSAKVLSIGCRFETELLYLVGHGFRRENVRGLDMISYSPWVDVGNMHALPYDDSSWDVVILGWVLPYSDDQARASSEVMRVCKDRAIVAIGLTYYPESTAVNLVSVDPRFRTSRIQTVSGLLSLFGESVGRVLFSHDAAYTDREGVCAVLFEVRKPPQIPEN
jgi:hypothetical protein